jgi:hypothetical protein
MRPELIGGVQHIPKHRHNLLEDKLAFPLSKRDIVRLVE